VPYISSVSSICDDSIQISYPHLQGFYFSDSKSSVNNFEVTVLIRAYFMAIPTWMCDARETG